VVFPALKSELAIRPIWHWAGPRVEEHVMVALVGQAICLPRISQPEPAQMLLVHQMAWALPEQPPPRIYKDQVPDVWPT
jgi:hypothetical protein